MIKMEVGSKRLLVNGVRTYLEYNYKGVITNMDYKSNTLFVGSKNAATAVANIKDFTDKFLIKAK